MSGPIEEKDFIRLVEDKGYIVVSSSKHHKILNSDGNTVMIFAVSHKKGGKREVKRTYINKFNKLILESEVEDNYE